MPSAEIITIGTELLLGEIVDTNTRFLARALRGLGVDLFRTVTIGDNIQRIAEAIQDSMRRADIVITTGGLGPTVDDPTREAAARAAGVETEFREDLWQQIQAVIARHGRVPSENQKRQAYIPKGAIAIENPVGTAPSFIVEANRTGARSNSIISLPGVPQEMELLFHLSVAPYLQKKFDLHDVIKVRILHTSGWSEASIDEKIGDFERLANPTVGLAAHTGIVDIRIAAKAQSERDVDRMIAEAETEIRARLGRAIFGADEETLEDAALRAAASRGWNVVALESGLDHGLARRLANVSVSNLLAVESADVAEPGQLSERTREALRIHSARAAFGIAVFPSGKEPIIEHVLITPIGEERWAVNFALNWLRQTAEKSA